MPFFQLVRREMQGSLNRLVLMAALGGISTASILAAINSGAQAADSGRPSLWSAMLFIIALLLFIKTQSYVLLTATAEIEGIIHKVRVRLMNHVRQSELLPLDEIGRAEIVAAITRETTVLAQASNTLAFAAQGAVLITFVALYVAYLSLLAFALSVVIVGIAAALFHSRNRQLAKATQESSQWENRLYNRVMDLLDGFKEVRLNHPRSEDLYGDILEVSRTAANIKIRTQAETFKRMVLLQSSMYAMLGAIVFAVPVLTDTLAGAQIGKTVTALVFVIGACFGLVQSIPILSAANAAAANIERLEARLAAAAAGIRGEAEPAARFDRIEMRNVAFSYVEKSTDAVFRVGPVDFTLRSGELVFITGGNGSGKSTFLKLLASLYKPDSGEITLDGVLVTDRTREAYRQLMSAIFVDYHLFQRLYGIPDPDPVETDRLLAQFHLLDKTHLMNGEFDTIDLSTGQRKRLALIVSMLEKRPILLLDEWAADQDPEFRRKFYFDLLPSLHRAGVTLVAVSHDDRYLDEMDLPARRLRMDEGRFVAEAVAETS
ncbi:MAG TPA: cyclic peptide export ABC transporter [Xanthobacteraceae bacterium]